MIITGAKGHAKEVLEILYQMKMLQNVAFFDNISEDLPNFLFDKFPILKNWDSAQKYIKDTDGLFVLGTGNPKVRYMFMEKFKELGGKPFDLISPFANIGHFCNKIGEGVNIMTGVVITNNVFIGNGALINNNCSISHDSIVNEFSELSPGVCITGNVKVGKFVTIGTGAVVLPGVSIGDYSIIGAGAVVINDIQANSLAVGVPAIVKKYNNLSF